MEFRFKRLYVCITIHQMFKVAFLKLGFIYAWFLKIGPLEIAWKKRKK